MNELVRIELVKYVDLRGNQFCSTDQLAFFKSIRVPLDSKTNTMLESDISSTSPCPQILQKLIWVERIHLFSSGWKTILISEEVAKIV